jgi:hypothetical protein
MADTVAEPYSEELAGRLAMLRVEHRDLDVAITAFEADSTHDQLQLRRMKRRKLLLKDQIAWLERQAEPDQTA